MKRLLIILLCSVSLYAEKRVYVLPYALEGGHYKVFLYKNIVYRYATIPNGILFPADFSEKSGHEYALHEHAVQEAARRIIVTFMPKVAFQQTALEKIIDTRTSTLFAYDIGNARMPQPFKAVAFNRLMQESPEALLTEFHTDLNVPLNPVVRKLLEDGNVAAFFQKKLSMSSTGAVESAGTAASYHPASARFYK